MLVNWPPTTSAASRASSLTTLPIRDLWRADMSLVKPKTNRIEGVNVDALGQTRFVTQQSFQLRA